MNLRDKKQFSELMIATASVYSKDISPQMLSMFWGILQDFDFEDVSAAFSAHLRKSKFFPTPAEILFYMQGAKSHVGADEAWAIALKSMDEEETVVWTQQILEARAIAWDVFVRGDEIAARMAFKDAYNRLVASAPPPVWNASLGFDAEQRITAINRSVDMGRLPQSKRLEIEQQPSVQRLIGQAEERVRLADEDGKIVDEIVKAKEHLSRIKSMLENRHLETQEKAQRGEFENNQQHVLSKAGC